MPYIKQDKRQILDVHAGGASAIGELNYVITKLALRFLGSEPDYAAYNAVIGVLECAKQEMYRRAVAPYEDKAIERNGDIYPKQVTGA